jgi:hypothetical protein
MNKFTNTMISIIKKIQVIIAKHNFNNIYKNLSLHHIIIFHLIRYEFIISINN